MFKEYDEGEIVSVSTRTYQVQLVFVCAVSLISGTSTDFVGLTPGLAVGFALIIVPVAIWSALNRWNILSRKVQKT
jgi:hypothetical protein